MITALTYIGITIAGADPMWVIYILPVILDLVIIDKVN